MSEDTSLPKILLIEDEEHLALGIRDNLEAEGYCVRMVTSGTEAWPVYQQGPYDLILLDVMLPGIDGVSLCARIRAQGGREPVLFLTAKNTPEDRVAGLLAGGDDYLGKPFHLQELLLRVRAMIRRNAWSMAAPKSDMFRLGDCVIDLKTYHVENAIGKRFELSQKEAMILKYLWEHAGEVASREDLLDYVWGYDVFPSTRLLDSVIVRLRKLLEPDPSMPRYIHTLRGVGYKLTPMSEMLDTTTGDNFHE